MSSPRAGPGGEGAGHLIGEALDASYAKNGGAHAADDGCGMALQMSE
jgi:hypothetical protein